MKECVPSIALWSLVSCNQQVVGGKKYCFTYQQGLSKKEYCVYSKSWENNFLEITLENGQKRTKGGVRPVAVPLNTNQNEQPNTIYGPGIANQNGQLLATNNGNQNGQQLNTISQGNQNVPMTGQIVTFSPNSLDD